MLTYLIFTLALVSQSKDGAATQAVVEAQSKRGDLKPTKEELWWSALEPIAQLEGDELFRQAAKQLDLRVLNLSLEPSAEDLNKVLNYRGYWLQLKRRSRFGASNYSALYLRAQQDLPGDFANRAWKDEAILVVDRASTRESVFHLLLHHLSEGLEKGPEKSFQEKQILEVQQDLFLLSRKSDFGFSDSDAQTILRRAEMNLKRFEESLAFFDLRKEEEKIMHEKLSQELKVLSAKIATFKDDKKVEKEVSQTEDSKGKPK